MILEGVQKVFGTLDLFVSLLETEIKYPILQGGILPFWTPSIYSYPYWRLKSNIRFYKGVFCLFGHPLRISFSQAPRY